MRFVAFFTLLLFLLITVARAQVSAEGQACLDCHSTSTPGIVEQWRESAHAKKNVDCYSCHRANEKDPAAFEHYGLKIAVIVTPYYCARCHKAERLTSSSRAAMPTPHSSSGRWTTCWAR